MIIILMSLWWVGLLIIWILGFVICLISAIAAAVEYENRNGKMINGRIVWETFWLCVFWPYLLYLVYTDR